jgi:nucleotide-binding universal stress UspA family protein
MTPYKHVLCPVDFSESSLRALSWSSRFSKSVAARLTVLHVVDTQILSMGNLVAVPEAFDALRRRAEEAIAGLKRRPDLAHAAVEVVEGIPEEVIANAANRGDVDLLVMGTHGLSGFQKFFLGSVTEKVLHRVQAPFLSISPAVGERSSEHPDPRTILMAIDFGPESESVVRHGTWLAEHFGARLIALHAVRVPYVVLNESSFEPLTRMEVDRLTDSLVAKRREDLEKVLPESPGTARETVVRVGPPFDVLRDVVGERSVDLLILGAGGHGEAGLRWLGSTCHKMVRLAPCPVMVVRR